MKKVKIYSTPTCGYCKLAKEYLSEKKIKFQEIDVAKNTIAAEEMTKKSGQMGVPVIIVTDEEGGREDIIIGFDKTKLATALGIPE